MTAAIDVREATVHYGEVLALDRATVTLQPGRICGLVGMNGSGKSTLFKTIMGSVTPDQGSVQINGGPPTAARKAGTIGYVPQSEEVDWAFPVSVRDVVMMGRYAQMGITRRPRPADRAAVQDALERVELTEFADRQIGQLSGGQKKRAFVARGIAQGATILLLDEPVEHLDTSTQDILDLLLDPQQLVGALPQRTILIVRHPRA